MDQRINLKFLVKLGKCPAECLKLLKEVYGEHVMSKTRVYEWHKRFKSGREEVEDDHKSGRPSTAKTPDNINRVNKLVRSDRRLTVRMMAEDLSMSSIACKTGFGAPGGIFGGTSHGCSTMTTRPLTPRSV